MGVLVFFTSKKLQFVVTWHSPPTPLGLDTSRESTQMTRCHTCAPAARSTNLRYARWLNTSRSALASSLLLLRSTSHTRVYYAVSHPTRPTVSVNLWKEPILLNTRLRKIQYVSKQGGPLRNLKFWLHTRLLTPLGQSISTSISCSSSRIVPYNPSEST